MVNFKVRETKSSPNVSLELSGDMFQSALVVHRMDTKMEQDCLIVQGYTLLAGLCKGHSGSFVYSFDVRNGIDAVCFETSENIIWKRGIGPINNPKK